MKKIVFLYCVLIIYSSNVFCQDTKLVNTNYSYLETNPSFAGSNGRLRIQTISRNEGKVFNAPNGAYYRGLDAYAKKLRGGVASSVLDESQMGGAYKSTNANIIYAPDFKCNET